MSSREIDALLDRLVGQFASPYDFLRELVQNAMDAGSDLAQVELETHRDEGDAAVFELVFADAGEGMDEAVIDGELTRLFATSKAGDHTMAGGFGIGFVSVFAWKPEVVLLQTGRAGEAWELVFHADRRFEKHRIDQPIEGTTVRMFRRDLAARRSAFAEAIRDSLWRWCRYCPIELTFEDIEAGTGPELIQDAPLPEDATVAHEYSDATTHVRLAFSDLARAVLLRHGLVLAEGTSREVLGELVEPLGDTLDHLRVWVDSPRLRSSLARDRVVDDEGRGRIADEIGKHVRALRRQLLHEVEVAAARPEPWTIDEHSRFTHLHAHLACERAHLGRLLLDRPVLRRPTGRPTSAAALRELARAGVVALVEPARAMVAPERDLLVPALRAGVPIIVGSWPDDRDWLEPLLAEVSLVPRPLLDIVSTVEPAESRTGPLLDRVAQLLRSAELPVAAVRPGVLADAPATALVGVTRAHNRDRVAIHAGVLVRGYLDGSTLWVDPRHPLLQGALEALEHDPMLATFALTVALLEHMGHGMPRPADIAEALDDLRGRGL